MQTLIVARTDAEAATFIDNNIDPRDHPFIIGATNACIPSLNQVLGAWITLCKFHLHHAIKYSCNRYKVCVFLFEFV
jgi:isocitrate lyase